MNSWTDGYVADIGYTHGFYRELTPSLLQFLGLLTTTRTPDLGAASAYCELGCGQGFTANLLAAANPHIEFFATDFNPSHIAGAQALAAEAGTPNIKFFDQSFADFGNEATLPAFDVIALHEFYSWIAPEHRSNIVQFINRKLKPGGLVYVSYNTMPGWAAASPMRHLMYLYGKSRGGPTASRLDPALQFVEKVIGSNARYFQANAGMKERFERTKTLTRNYLAHEYLNDAWTLLYHSDVVAEMAEAKLTYVGSAAPLDYVDQINLTPDQQKVLAEVHDPALRETVRDSMVNQQFRRDVFIKGPLGLTDATARWQALRVALSTPRAKVPLKVSGSLGDATLSEEAYGPVLDALAQGSKTLSQLMADPLIARKGLRNLMQCVTILMGAGHLQPCLDPKGEAERPQPTKAFNQAVMKRAAASNDLAYLASPVTGGGVAVDRLSQLFLAARQGKQPDAAQYVWDVLLGQGHRVLKDGKALQSAEESLAELRERLAQFASDSAATLAHLGIP